MQLSQVSSNNNVNASTDFSATIGGGVGLFKKRFVGGTGGGAEMSSNYSNVYMNSPYNN